MEGFKLAEIQPLAKLLIGKINQPTVFLNVLIDWTGGQPFLTQVLFTLALEQIEQKQYHSYKQSQTKSTRFRYEKEVKSCNGFIMKPMEIEHSNWLEHFVHATIIRHWETRPIGQHFREISSYIFSQKQLIVQLLREYQQVLRYDALYINTNTVHHELIRSGLVIVSGEILTVANQIYKKVFNQDWVKKKLSIFSEQ
ncbi:MAG: hypothetical protein AAGD25_20415 [Cyanobacteria bacterium P01_F01_bin.150]